MCNEMDFITSDNPKGLQDILNLPEKLRKNTVKSFGLNDSDVENISRTEYEDNTDD